MTPKKKAKAKTPKRRDDMTYVVVRWITKRDREQLNKARKALVSEGKCRDRDSSAIAYMIGDYAMKREQLAKTNADLLKLREQCISLLRAMDHADNLGTVIKSTRSAWKDMPKQVSAEHVRTGSYTMPFDPDEDEEHD